MNNIALWRTQAVGYTKTVEIGVPLLAGESLSHVHYALVTRLDWTCSVLLPGLI
jgi:hypothetical protein